MIPDDSKSLGSEESAVSLPPAVQSNKGITAMNTLTGSPALKVQVMCEGIRYTESLGLAARHSMPNYYPYRFKAGEHDPTGKGTATIPYLINTADGTEIR